jgi:murein DD-endopeptidase MepM/ murein hydrolase activator NlpD
MARCLLVCLAFLLVLAAPAAGDDIYQKKRELDARLSTLHSKIADAKAQEGVLTDEITVANAKIGALVDDVSQARAQLAALEAQLAASQRRLDRMTARFEYQTKRLVSLRKQYSVALSRLERRLIDAYETPDVNVVDVLLASTSMSDMLSDMEYVQQIGRQDQRISDQLHSARKNMAEAREETRVIKRRIAEETAAIRTRTDVQQSVTAQLISTQQQLATARDSKRATLSSIKVNEDEFVKESQALATQSASLGAQIRAAEAKAAAAAAAAAAPTPSSGGPAGGSTSTAPSSSGFIWPVQGPIASPFGSRCLPNGDCSLHPGIDIAAPAGTPIHAAAAGTVIYAGWGDGYGNLVVIDHGHSLATAYGHQSSIAVGLGTSVAQGQVIGYVGCTGYCFGDHLHFEVRVNGEPVDPLGYL